MSCAKPWPSAQTKSNFLSAMREADPIAVEAVRVEGLTAVVNAGDLISARIREIYKGTVANP
jgi:hypothetical protein